MSQAPTFGRANKLGTQLNCWDQRTEGDAREPEVC